MVLARPLLRRLRPSALALPIRTARSIGTSNLHTPENSSPKSAQNPSLRPDPSQNPVLQQYNEKVAAQKAAAVAQTLGNAASPASSAQTTNRDTRRGHLAPSSLFNNLRDSRTQQQNKIDDKSRRERNLESLSATLDPKPAARRRWERKMVIRSIQRRGRLTKAEVLKRTERQLLAKSDLWRTSMKKLQPLARQIAGKTIEDAIVQMQFSRKKNAALIKGHLEEARDRAIVERGMGLGKADGAVHSPIVVRDNNGVRRVVKDKTGIYIAQAWVGKGSYGIDGSPRARGRVDRLMLPQTSISVLLKEEATLVREHAERQERLRKKKVWTQLPDRPITEQRPFYTW